MKLLILLVLAFLKLNLAVAQDRTFSYKEAALLLNVKVESLKEVRFISKTKQWVVYDDTEASGSKQHVYLLPESFKNKDKIITIVEVARSGYRLIDNIVFKNDTIEILSSNNRRVVLKNKIPPYSDLRKFAYEFYDVRSTGWRFLKNGIKNFPTYSKVKSIYKKCEVISKEKKKNKCYKKEEKILARELLSSTLLHDKDNKSLVEYLKHKDLRYSVTSSLIRAYKNLLESQALSEEYDWSDSSVTNYSRKFFFHYTLDVSGRMTYFSPGHFWWKPSAFSVRYGYYPILSLKGSL